ncbi:MAG: ABC transporter substrate-binding protein [Desulfobacteraceae bacterium]|nr:ABC transporter substrate-binding protein [Desulfobacteraceae bacterium]
MKMAININAGLKIIIWMLAALLCLAQPTFAAKGISVKDSIGNPLHFETSPKRIVSLVPTAAEILVEIGAGHTVAGLTYHDLTLKGASDKDLIGGFFMPSLQKIKAANPDMIIVSSLHKEVIDIYRHTDCRIFVYDTDNIEHSYENITTFGKIVGREAQAKKVIIKNKIEINHTTKKLDKAADGRKKRVIRLMGRDKIMTPGNDSFQNELIRLSGGLPPDFGKKGSVVEVTKENWIKFNPEVIYGCGGDEQAAKAFFSKPGWKDVDAVKNGKIYYFPCDLTCRAATHSGYFVSWLASMIYMEEFAKPQNNILPVKITESKPVKIDLEYIRSASINTANIYDFENKTLMVDFKRPQAIVSTLEGERDGILTVGNHYSPPPTWGPGHSLGIDDIRANILKANDKVSNTTSFLITGADMDNLSLKEKAFKDMKVVALATAGVMSNAVRMSKDVGSFYEPGTINIIIMTNMQLSKRAMTRAIIAATEAKTAALEDMDIRSSYTPLIHEATGTGTDNILVVQGEGLPVKNAGGHSKMGELIASAVYDAVNQAILKQNKITADRHIFQRLKERKISLNRLTSEVNCDCMNQKKNAKSRFAIKVDHLLLEKEYAGFIESALALSDEYEKGLIKDLSLFDDWCKSIASRISNQNVSAIEDHVHDDRIPVVLETALNAVFTGVLEQMRYE